MRTGEINRNRITENYKYLPLSVETAANELVLAVGKPLEGKDVKVSLDVDNTVRAVAPIVEIILAGVDSSIKKRGN